MCIILCKFIFLKLIKIFDSVNYCIIERHENEMRDKYFKFNL